ncbi:hypothetical protein AGMMS50256_30430 [Betaproteobacteria bacterium]|nr:hypothetical protein AGMMS50256_30430 [Betaproteobacteria bacterium]
MNTPLMRDSLRAVRPQEANHAHAGLWLTRGLESVAEGDNTRKSGHINKLCAQDPSHLYNLAWKRWRKTVDNTERFCQLHAKLSQRLFIGQSSASALETGICVSHSYGMPMIPGSTVKGCARAYAEAAGLAPEYLAVLFGELSGAACLVWHDAWWNPDSGKPFVHEIVTTHHMEYYSGNASEATDFDSPVPNAQIATQGSFCFVVEGPFAWASKGIAILEKALAESGIGAKRAAGYGVMESDAQKERRQAEEAQRLEMEKLKQKIEAEQRQQQNATEWPGARVKFNRTTGALIVEKDGKTAIALAPKGAEFLQNLPANIRQKILNNQFVRITAYVAKGTLMRIEVPSVP